MFHKSIKLDTPIELVNVTPLNPLISKCQIKVLYVQDTPNRNRSIITKETAKLIANSLPGSPIVGNFYEDKQDYGEHDEVIQIKNGKLEFLDLTRPYGFVDLGAKVWFQWFLDDDSVEREYLMTEGYIWTGQYPESKRILEKGNNHSLEFDPDIIDGSWAKNSNGTNEFFIINEAIISKLCILGQDEEPCFEGSHITAPQIQFSFSEDFTNQMTYMITELKNLLNEGGEKVFTKFAVEIGDACWTAMRQYLDTKEYSANYSLAGMYLEEEQAFAVLKSEDKMYRLNFSYAEEGLQASEELVELSSDSISDELSSQFSLEALEAFETEYKKKDEKKKEEEDDSGEGEEKKPEDKKEAPADKEEKPAESQPKESEGQDGEEEDDDEDDKKKKKKYVLEEVSEYVELKQSYSVLEEKYNTLVSEHETLKAEKEELLQFKNQQELADKEAKINEFSMLSEEDKKDVVENINKYSVQEIEEKLAVICYRNRVKFDPVEEDNQEEKAPTTYNLNGDMGNDGMPDWVKEAMSVQKEIN